MNSIYNVFDRRLSSFVHENHKGQISIDKVMRNYPYARSIQPSHPPRFGDKIVEYERDFQPEKLLLLVEPFKAKSRDNYFAKAIKSLMEEALCKEKYVEIVSDERLADKILQGSVKKKPPVTSLQFLCDL